MGETLKVSEIFGPTFQGEGPSTGQRAAFIRLAGCNLHCVWCDTPYTWNWQLYDPKQEINPMAVPDIVRDVHNRDCRLVVITGGEPFIQNRYSLMALTSRLMELGHILEFETNGTQMGFPEDLRIQYNISPKLNHAGDPAGVRIIPVVLNSWVKRPDARWKFVVRNESDEAEIKGLLSGLGISSSDVWIMPEGQTPAQLDVHQEAAMRVAEALKCNYTDRLHIRLWGGERGK